MAAAAGRQPPGPAEGEAPAAGAAGREAGAEEGEGRAKGGVEAGGCYLALCARPVHFEKANPVNCVFFDEANKQVGARGLPRAGLRVRACGFSPARCFASLPALCSYRPSAAGHEPGSFPSGPVIVLEAVDFFFFLYRFIRLAPALLSVP